MIEPPPTQPRDRDSLGVWCAWVVLGLLVLVNGASLVWHGQRVWEIDVHDRAQILASAGVYALAVVASTVLARRARALTTRASLAASAGALFAGYAFLAFLPEPDFSRSLLLACSLFTLVWPAAWQLVRPRSPRGRTASLFAVAVLAVAPVLAPTTHDGFRVERRLTQTQRYSVEITEHAGLIPRPVSTGGSITRYEDGYLLMTGDGAFFGVSDDGEVLRTEPVALRLPMDRDRFHAEAPPATPPRRFRAHDLLVMGGRDPTVLVTHHVWDSTRRCLGIRLSAARPGADALIGGPGRPSNGGASAEAANAEWRTVFQPEPCVALVDRAGFRPAIHMFGGALARLDDRHVLMTVGNPSEARLAPQDSLSGLGKTFRIDIATGEATVFSRGHRNAQGLAVTGAGEIWSTEHGPNGGDELNLLHPGANYGWPYRTYGVEYEAPTWPEFPRADSAVVLTEPVHAWVPSIGVSSLIEIEGRGFTDWSGQLLVGSLKGRSVARVRLDGHRVVFVEPIEIGHRVRDLAEGADGAVVLWTDRAVLVRIRRAPATNGSRLYTQCAGCHAIDDGTSHGLGPDLAGVYGRRIGGAPGFEYSAALRDWDGRWTARELFRYIRNPQGAAPGTTMEHDGIADSMQVAELVQYLQAFP